MDRNRLHTLQAGVALAEFALTVPILAMLLVGLVEFGRLAYFTIEVSNAAHAGAEYGALPNNAGDFAGMQTVATNDGANGISALIPQAGNVCACWNGTTETPSPPTAAVCRQPCAGGARQVTYVQVSVTGVIRPIFNYGALGLPASWNVVRVATIRAAQ
jgi:Flp pilus assembly protein TadG